MVAGALLWEVVLLLHRQRQARQTVQQYLLIHGSDHDAAP